MTNWSPIQPESVWPKVAVVLRRELGDGPFNSYVAPSSVRPGPFGDPVLVTPTAYARDWISKNAIRRAQELWSQYDPDARVLDVRCRAEFEDQAQAVAVPDPAEVAVAAAPAAEAAVEATPHNRISGLQERLTFDTFVAGRGNEFAYQMSRQVASWAFVHLNPVFFHGQ
jgi:chromosomal replication initiator protein